MSAQHKTTNLTNPHYLSVWCAASSKALQADPNDPAALYVHFVLRNLFDAYVTRSESTDVGLSARIEIFNNLQRAAMSASKAAKEGMFFEGLALLEGFGCTPDPDTGKALIQVAAVARGSKIAANFIRMHSGIAHLFGRGAAQSYKAAIQHLKAAGAIAQPHLGLLAAHMQKMRIRLLPTITPRQETNIVTLDAASAALRLRG